MSVSIFHSQRLTRLIFNMRSEPNANAERNESSEFHENRRRHGPTFLTFANKMHLCL